MPRSKRTSGNAAAMPTMTPMPASFKPSLI